MAKISFGGVEPFYMNIRYIEADSKSISNVSEQHVHDECEIYFNLSGDVSFMVEDNIYPIIPGSAVITRPYENHHCIYHSNAVHKHYWILFSCRGNEKYLDLFFNRTAGVGNLIVLTPEGTERLITAFNELCGGDIPEYSKQYRFFEVMDILSSGVKKSSANAKLSPDVASVINEINADISKQFSVSDLAAGMHVSVNTLERHFKQQIGITPGQYILRKRMAGAAEVLAKGGTVHEAYEINGFSDYSHFISLFKKHFGVTPNKYKKSR